MFEECLYFNSNALARSVTKVWTEAYREFELSEISECVLGELFAYFILETAVVGKLLRVNPFNQPAVEQVKIKTKKLLV